MFAKESLYINAIKYKSQLKINYKKLNGNEITETNNSTFVVKDDILGRDIATKINTKQSEVNDTYISTLLLQEDVKLLKKSQIKPKDYVSTSLNNDFDIAVSKNTLFETKNFFEKCGVDYIFSAYHILNLHIEQNPCQNNLVVLLFNNQAFCFILNTKGEVVFERRVDITPFEEIQESKFYENELLGQKLYDEVYALELNEIIKNIIEDFYKISKNIFIEKISLLYNIKLVSEEQIEQISDELMLETTYHPISVDEELFELSKDKHKNKSFIKPRIKPSDSLKSIFFAIVLVLAIVAIGYQFVPINNFIGKKEEKTSEQVIKKEEIKKPILVTLPNHIEANSFVETRVLKLFEFIPYDVVLNELIIDEDSCELSINLLNKDTYIKILQPDLLKIYKNSKINFNESDNNSPILEAVITADNLNEKFVPMNKEYKDIYIQNEFMPIIRVTEQIKILFPENTIVSFKSSSKGKFTTFNYLINVVIEKPLEFFNIINRISNELYSINISYPITFIKTAAGIEVEFILQFHQPK